MNARILENNRNTCNHDSTEYFIIDLTLSTATPAYYTRAQKLINMNKT